MSVILNHLTAKDRANNYIRTFPKYAPLTVHNDRLYGIWIIGALYRRRQGYYGEYPHSVKKRILALFPDCSRVLHLCSGTIHDLNSITFDINPATKPTICDDVRNVKDHKDVFSQVDLVIADPPYEKRDFDRYGQKPFNKPQAIRDLGEIMKPNSFLVWLDLMVPIYNKKIWNLMGHIGLVISTNTRVRMLTLWQHTAKV